MRKGDAAWVLDGARGWVRCAVLALLPEGRFRVAVPRADESATVAVERSRGQLRTEAEHAEYRNLAPSELKRRKERAYKKRREEEGR